MRSSVRASMSTRAPAPRRKRATSCSRCATGVLKKTGVRGDLFELCGGKAKGRTKANEITLFKSVGTALEDLAAAMLVYRSLG